VAPKPGFQAGFSVSGIGDAAAGAGMVAPVRNRFPQGRNGRNWFTIAPDIPADKVARGNAGPACDMSTTTAHR